MDPTQFLSGEPYVELREVLGVLRRPRREEDRCFFDPPDWLPMFSTIAVDGSRLLRRSPGGTAHYLVIGQDWSPPPRRWAASVFSEGRTSGLSVGARTAEQIARGDLVSAASGGVIMALVPDHVYAVRLHFGGRPEVLETTENNLWVHAGPRDSVAASSPDDYVFPFRVDWLDATGQTVKTLS